jgi:hypothetical protein
MPALFLAAMVLTPGAGGTVPVQVKTSSGRRQATLPFTLDHNRMIVEAQFVRPDGTIRKARAWVDTGSQNLVVAESLARDLGLDLSGLKRDGQGQEAGELETAGDPRVRGPSFFCAGL